MDSFQPRLPQQRLPIATFEQLRLWVEQTAQEYNPDAIVLTERAVRVQSLPQVGQFTLGVSPQFCAIVWGNPQPGTPVDVGFSLERHHLETFLEDCPLKKPLRNRALKHLQGYELHRDQQSQLTLNLAQFLSDHHSSMTSVPSTASGTHQMQDALQQHRQQEQLLKQVTTQTCQSVALAVLISNTVDRVCRFLDLDRLCIYQFDNYSQDEAQRGDRPQAYPQSRDCITYEALGNDSLPSVLSRQERVNWRFLNQFRDRYQEGETLVFQETHLRDSLPQSSRAYFEALGIQTHLTVPIRVQGQLWGVLLAHQCDRPRLWDHQEREFLEHIADHLSVAIYQAQLYAEVQQQKETLEQRVEQRTQDLRDALVTAQVANQTRSDFLATVSHELRTPLTCIIGMSSTLLRWSFGNLTPKQRDYIQSIYNSGEHLMELINDLLDLSENESGKTVLSFSEFSLTQLAQEMFCMMVDRATVNGVHLALDLQLREHQDRLCADRDRLRQILFNLLSNAIKFTATGGQALLRIYWQDRDTVVFEVADTGIGIPEEQRSLLFQMFRQLESTYTRQYGGTGLGLALTKQLVELHGGLIKVDSEVGVGSKFTVRLPCHSSCVLEQQPTPPPRTPLPPRKGHVVLVANREDDAILICDLLTAAGYHTVWMLDGSTALEQIKMLKPVAAIIDRQLPGMDGCELTQLLRTLPNTQSLKILLMTDPLDAEGLAYCKNQGADICLTHPIDPEKLLNSIIELLIELPASNEDSE
ncbi:ATP-binding protein [Phormidium yuhuli AB48]|uniref:histidine kinase n=1 Tax=Phormidium yuhuli AB48 TaxID=2940671 RepID=A0ABY5AU87_9CYAN|nr:GAF domain-containing hybrid sensor histidine kinase/response regulator [Phormidium yuhuli]USR92792.1 ATP-binding protein [Phormidium yuhuli AB48]